MKVGYWFVFPGLALIFLFISSNAAFAGALDAFSGEKGNIRVAGGTAHIPVMKDAAIRIMKYNPKIHISIAGGGSGAGIRQAGEGLVDIGNSGRRASEAEISRYSLKMFKWAVDGVGIVVNPSNRVRSLSREQTAAVFSGKITSWHEIGGDKQRINIYTRDESSGTRSVFWKKALKKGMISQAANFVVSNGAMKAAISHDPYGIGYVSVGHMDGSVAGVAFDHVKPTLENVRTGKYPIVRGLYSNTRGEPAGLVKKFITYLFSGEGQEIVAQKGLVPVK